MADTLTLSAQALTCQRGGRAVFQGLDFSVASGEALLVTGRNGAGKSSLLRMIAGLLRIADGTLSLAGGDAERSIGEQAHYLGHSDALKSSLTVAENLVVLDRMARRRREAAAMRWPRSGSNRWPTCRRPISRPGRSAGFRSRGWWRCERPLWLLDEPTSALDTAAQAMLLELMRAQLARGGIVVAATHLPLGLDDARELKLERAA